MLSPIKFLNPEEDIPGSFIHRDRRVIRVGCGNPSSKKKYLQLGCYKIKGKSEYTETNGKFICNICPKSKPYKKYNSCQQHTKLHFLPEFECTDCSQRFHTRNLWNNHFNYECPYCGIVKIGKENMKTHMNKRCKRAPHRETRTEPVIETESE